MLNLSQKLQKISHVIGRNVLSESFLPFRLIYKLVRKVNFTWTVNRNGSRFKILIKDGMGIMNFVSDYEPWLDEILPKLLDKRDAVFLDIGANTGQTMIKILPRFPEVRYLGVEPNEYCVKYLQALSKVNKFKSVKILAYALSDATGEVELLTRYQDDILATTTHSFRKFTKYAIKKQVRMISGDALIEQENIKELSLIKIDIEGGESKAIQGLLNTIRKFQPYIICEILPLSTEDKDVTVFRTIAANKILSHMCDLNYIVLNIFTGNPINQVEELSDSHDSCNYLFVPNSKLTSLKL